MDFILSYTVALYLFWNAEMRDRNENICQRQGRTRDQLVDSLTALQRKDATLTANAVETRHPNMGQQGPPIKLSMISHQLGKMMWVAAQCLAAQSLYNSFWQGDCCTSLQVACT
jgi:hypothetical protein